jgi:anti-sigma-K factor RskA
MPGIGVMTYSEDHIALAAEYALGTLDADERALVETMMIVDNGFKELVDAWERKLAPLHQMVGPIEPPDHVWDKIKLAAGLGVSVPDAPVSVEAAPSASGIVSSADVAAAATDARERVADVAGHTVETGVADADRGREAVAVPQPSNVTPLPVRKRGMGAYSVVMTALAASLAGVVALQAYRPELLPEPLRIKPKVQVVEVRTPAPPTPAQLVAVLQQGAAEPAFILTVDTATRNFTVRKVGAAAEPGKSFELWLVSDKLPGPRSLGVIGGSEFTSRPALSSYDADTISNATYAVTIEPQGGSPSGRPTANPIFAGKLIESVPAGTAPAR